jgi:PTH1 family peptidyl-tRNA hydrolase
MKSVIQCLGTEEFTRVRVGIGKPRENEDIIKYVIGPVSNNIRKKLEQGTNLAAEATLEILKNGVDVAMNKYN